MRLLKHCHHCRLLGWAVRRSPALVADAARRRRRTPHSGTDPPNRPGVQAVVAVSNKLRQRVAGDVDHGRCVEELPAWVSDVNVGSVCCGWWGCGRRQ